LNNLGTTKVASTPDNICFPELFFDKNRHPSIVSLNDELKIFFREIDLKSKKREIRSSRTVPVPVFQEEHAMSLQAHHFLTNAEGIFDQRVAHQHVYDTSVYFLLHR